MMRTRLTFRNDGSCHVAGVGADDRPSKEEGQYTIVEGDPVVIEIRLEGGTDVLLEVADTEPDLVLTVRS